MPILMYLRDYDSHYVAIIIIIIIESDQINYFTQWQTISIAPTVVYLTNFH